MKVKNETDLALAFIKALLEKILTHKYIYILSVVLFVAGAFFINKYSSKAYKISSTIGPLSNTRTSSLESNDMFRGVAGSINTSRNLEDAINSLNSFALVSKTITDLNLEIGYFVESTPILNKYSEVYQNSPVIVNIDKSHVQSIDVKFNITFLNNNSYKLTANAKEANLYNYIDNDIVEDHLNFNIDTICKFNDVISNRYLRFSVMQNPNYFASMLQKKKPFYFQFYHQEELAKEYLKSFKIEPVSWLASIIRIQFTGSNLRRSLNFLNSYINLFLEENLSKKNQIAVNTINFIDKQISGMSDSLSKSESRLKNYRSDNQVMDLSFQGQRTYEQLAQIEAQKTNLDLQSRYYNYVLNYFKSNQDVGGVNPPSSANITDPVINKLITDLITLNSEKSTLSGNNEKNLFSVQLENKIKIQKQTIIDNLTSSLSTINLNLNELNYKSEKLNGELALIPKKEMNMVNIQRKFDINNTMYTYLLQKRTESQISLSSNYPDYEVIEPAREITSQIVKPKILLNYAVSIFLALLLPTMYVLIRYFLSAKLSSVYEAEMILGRQLMGTIYRNNKKYENVVTKYPGSAIAESFRNLRSSIFLKLRPTKSKIILITSSQPQDGKSFIAFNLASSIASVGFKTVIIDCDLRRPVQHGKFGIENNDGVSNYLIHKAKPEEIIIKTETENLYFVPAGPVLPNPSELISSGGLDDIIAYLSDNFDYVLIDTPPVGLISDSFQLIKYANLVLLVSRNEYTKKEILANTIASFQINGIENYELVMNNLDLDKSPYSRYSSYYHKD